MADSSITSSSDSDTEHAIPSLIEQLFNNRSSHVPSSLVPTMNPELFLLHALKLSLLNQSLRESLVDDLRMLASGSGDAYKMFLPSGAESQSVMLGKNLEKWSSIQHPEGQGQFFRSFMSKVNSFLSEDFQRKFKRPECVPQYQPTILTNESVTQLLLKLTNDPSMLSLVNYISNLLTSVFEEAHNNHSVPNYPHQRGDETVYVSDFSAISDENLKRMIYLFTPKAHPQSREGTLKCLLQYVPKKQVECETNDLVTSFSLLRTDTMQCVQCHTRLTRKNACSQCKKKPFVITVSTKKEKFLAKEV